MVRVLELLVSQLPQTERIVFTDRTGTRTVIVPGKCGLDLAMDYAEHKGQGNGFGSDSEFYDLPFLWTSKQRDALRSSVKAQIGLELKEVDRMNKQDSGHHFGGYRPGKNKRQGPSMNGLFLDDVDAAARVFGIPAHVLQSTPEAFSRLDWLNWYERSFGNGNNSYNG